VPINLPAITDQPTNLRQPGRIVWQYLLTDLADRGRIALAMSTIAGCDDPQVYGSIGFSSGFKSWGGSGSRVGGSISIGGRIM
jgi:hypothetical protein